MSTNKSAKGLIQGVTVWLPTDAVVMGAVVADIYVSANREDRIYHLAS
jgi:hypothetical protein